MRIDIVYNRWRKITVAFPRWKSFSSSAVCTSMKREEVNSIPSESWLDHVGEEDRSGTDMYVCWCTWF